MISGFFEFKKDAERQQTRVPKVWARNVWYGPVWWQKGSPYQVSGIRCTLRPAWGSISENHVLRYDKSDARRRAWGRSPKIIPMPNPCPLRGAFNNQAQKSNNQKTWLLRLALVFVHPRSGLLWPASLRFLFVFMSLWRKNMICDGVSMIFLQNSYNLSLNRVTTYKTGILDPREFWWVP